ncbi:MAG TPA: pyridoxal-phosphate dependent enzyme [Acidimicrobiia bacterium]|nr:pyridoxal-phosphate dependent enzyme [Acidimicrobiia bacterium]
MNTGFPPSGMWRFASLLPVADPGSVISLGEGGTPLIEAGGPTLSGLPLASLTMKAEHRNPTGSFKDRIAAVATALIREGGLAGTVGTSSGNGGAAIAAYGARAGFPVVLFTTSGIVDGKLEQILAHGATVHIVKPGDGSATEEAAPTIARLADEAGWLPFLTGARYLPAAMQGAETIAFELAEQHADADVVYVPVGGGGLLGSIWRGYERLGVTPPRLVGAQPAGCPTLLRGVAGDTSPLPGPVTTTISGLQVSVLFDFGAIDAVRQGGGHVVEVTDEEAWAAQRLLAREEGLFVEPAGATALAGALRDLEVGRLAPGEHAVVVLSGAGHKDPSAVRRLVGDNQPIRVAASDVEAAFDRVRGLA